MREKMGPVLTHAPCPIPFLVCLKCLRTRNDEVVSHDVTFLRAEYLIINSRDPLCVCVCIGRNVFGVEARTVVVNPLYYTIKKRTMVSRVVGGARTVDGQAECLEDQTLGRCVWDLGSGVTTEGSCSFVLYYDHINIVTRNTQPL